MTKQMNLALFGLVSVLLMCVCFAIFASFSTPKTNTIPASSPPTVEPAQAPTDTPIPIPTDTPIPLPPDTPTPKPAPTFTPEPIVAPELTPTPAPTVCNCSSDSYNCKDFGGKAEAQACFDYCVSQGKGDIHGLDGNDNDGLACESL